MESNDGKETSEKSPTLLVTGGPPFTLFTYNTVPIVTRPDSQVPGFYTAIPAGQVPVLSSPLRLLGELGPLYQFVLLGHGGDVWWLV